MSKKVLIIEDEPSSIRRIPKKLKEKYQEEIQIDQVKDPDAAIEKLKNETYDLILLDIMFESGSFKKLNNYIKKYLDDKDKYNKYYRRGIALVKLIKGGFLGKNNMSTPILVISATPDKYDIEEIKELIDEEYYFEKPIETEIIIEKIRQILKN